MPPRPSEFGSNTQAMFLALVAHGAQPRQRHVDPDPVPQQQQEQPEPAPLLPATAAYSLQHRSIVHRADGMQGIGITLAGMLLAFQLAERSNRSLYTDWPMFLESFEGKNDLPEELSGLPTQSLEAWTWALPGHETTTVGAAARAAAADGPTVLELSGDDLSVEQVRDAWRSAMNKSASEEQAFEDYNRHIFFERCARTLVRQALGILESVSPFSRSQVQAHLVRARAPRRPGPARAGGAHSRGRQRRRGWRGPLSRRRQPDRPERRNGRAAKRHSRPLERTAR